MIEILTDNESLMTERISMQKGQVVSHKKLCEEFELAPIPAGILKSENNKTIVVKICLSEEGDFFSEGVYYYEGFGLKGNQSLSYHFNRLLYTSAVSGYKMHLFVNRCNGEYEYIGEIMLASEPFVKQRTNEYGVQQVWVFPLKEGVTEDGWKPSEMYEGRLLDIFVAVKQIRDSVKVGIDAKSAHRALWVVEELVEYLLSLNGHKITISKLDGQKLVDNESSPLVFSCEHTLSYIPNNISQTVQLLQMIIKEENISDKISAEIYELFNRVIDWFWKELLGAKQAVCSEEVNHSIEIKSVNEFDLYEEIRALKKQIEQLKQEQNTKMSEVHNEINAIHEEISEIRTEIRMINEAIAQKQEDITEYLKTIADKEIEELIMHAFSEQCTSAIMNSACTEQENAEYKKEIKLISLKLGVDAWNKLRETSKRFLITAKITFGKMMVYEDIIDYSGICLLMTKALEEELTIRFYNDYINYLNKHLEFKSNSNKWPYSLVQKYTDRRTGESRFEIIPECNFTIGKAIYVLGGKIQQGEPKDRINNDEELLFKYANAELFKERKDKTETVRIFRKMADDLEIVRVKYRNPAAHKNELTMTDAINCISFVVEVERILGKMLDLFKK